MKPTDQYELDLGQIQLALDVLRREQQASELSRFQKICYWLFQCCGYLFAASFVAMLGSAFVRRASGYDWVAELASLGTGLFGLLALVLVFMNLPLMLKARRRERIVSKLGLAALLSGSWKTQQRRRRLVNVVSAVIAAFFGLVAVLILIGGIVAYNIDEGSRVGKRGNFGLAEFAMVIGVAVPVISVPVLVFIVRRRRNRHRFLMDMQEIERSLLRYKDAVAGSASPRVAVPAADVECIAAMEQEQIATERADSIRSFGKKDSGGFALLPSRDFHETKSRLDLATSTRVDALMQRLTDEPRPAEAQRDPDSDGWLLRIPDTDWTISYDVDHQRNSVKLFRLRRANETRTAD
jgi:ABC-type multidrug transport system fused ATPase/permease subunit